ncbi:hypothetical protein ABZ912_12850 [Nonomuraea angiospora]|uniref:terpene synthase family protein n=1 Tax=Nonomuraea angiospora TaxID=46172 RepID=UPI0033DA3000
MDRLLHGSHQLAGVPDEDRSGVLRTALDAVPEAAGLVRPYPDLLADGDSAASRLAFSCLSAAATFPRARPDQIADLGTMITILFAFDDIADNIAGQWSHHDITAFFKQLRAMVSGAPARPSGEDALAQGLRVWQAWCARFRGHEGAAAHAANLREQLELAGAAMMRERRWAAGEEPWPTYDEYVSNGSLTILYPTWWAAALAICGPAPADAGHWDSIARVTSLGAACMRLVNDIRTFERERSEGKPSSVLILERAGLPTKAAVERVFAHYAELHAAFLAALASLPEPLAGIAEGQRRNVAFNGGWYMARDTHAYTVRELASDADAYKD